MKSRKDVSHTRREVEKSLRKYYSGQRTDSSDWSRRKKGPRSGFSWRETKTYDNFT